MSEGGGRSVAVDGLVVTGRAAAIIADIVQHAREINDPLYGCLRYDFSPSEVRPTMEHRRLPLKVGAREK